MFKKLALPNYSIWKQLKIFSKQNSIQVFKRTYCEEVKSELKTEKISYPRRIFSGIQPTGSVHVGNYFGAIQKWVELQDSGEDVIWSIVDMHSITLPRNPLELKENIMKLTANVLACGIDPEKSILFQQSSVSMHAELSWIFTCLVTMPRLSQQPQFKEKCKKLKAIPLGLYIYPVLQTADILLYKATHVPVGEDQVQHINLSKHLAQKFNSTYGETFPMPEEIVNKDASRIKSLRNPTEKMSKSCPDVKSRIELTDEPDVLLNKVKKAVTDCTSELTYEPEKRPGVANLLNIHSIITGKSPEDICKEFEGVDTGKYKLILADIIIDKLDPIRKKIIEYTNEPEYLQEVLQIGARKAEAIAITNWLEIRDKVGYGINTLSVNIDKLHLRALR